MTARPDIHDLHFLMAEHKLKQGIQSLRAAMGLAMNRGLATDAARLDARIVEVRRMHLEYGERGIQALPTYRDSTAIDSGPIFALVEGKDKIDALFAMASVAVPTRASVEVMAREEREKFLLSRYFPLVQHEERGRTAARSDRGTGDADLWARMCHRAVMLYELSAQLHVEPHRWKIGIDHAVELNDFFWIACVSPFVPADRAPLFARGLLAGMQGNFGLAVHLLIPQVENAVREIVRAGAAADEGLKAAHEEMLADIERPSLGEALCAPWSSELARVFGEEGGDLVFALRVLLIERFGGNLRNRIFHGLTSYGGVESWQCWYFWWLVLKVCCSTALEAARGTSDRRAGGGGAEGGEESPSVRGKPPRTMEL